MREKANILIVDDDPGMTETLADILSELSYDVAVAEEEICRERRKEMLRRPGPGG